MEKASTSINEQGSLQSAQAELSVAESESWISLKFEGSKKIAYLISLFGFLDMKRFFENFLKTSIGFR